MAENEDGKPPPMTCTLRWARDPADDRMHALAPNDLALAAARGHAETLCGHRLPTGLTVEDCPSGALCLPCVIGVTSEMDDPGRFGAWTV